MDPEIIDEEEEMVTVDLGEEGEPGEEPGSAEEEPEEGEPGEEPGAMSREERHRQAAARRAREDAQRAAAHQAEIDAAYARAYAGQTDPYHGHKPIRTEADYRAYIQARDEEQERQNLERMREGGVDPQLLEQLISRAVLDEFRRINPGHTDAEYALYWHKLHKNES